jgi:hypothetical protein
VRYPSEWYQMDATIAERLPGLRPAQQRGLTWWVYGVILAQSICQNAVITALLTVGGWHGLRQYLREWLYDGEDKAAPCHTQVDVAACFPALLRWVLAWWEGRDLALAVDATAHGETVVALVVSVLYRGCAIPVAWLILPANQKGAWMAAILRLLRLLRPALSPELTVLVLADRGLWSPRLWKRIRDFGWHPLLRIHDNATFQPCGGKRQPVRSLVPGPGHAWVGQGIAFKHRPVRRAATLVVVWASDQKAPWILLTDLRPTQIGVCWYGLRVWIELGFRALKGVGWQWQHTRRSDPPRVARSWLILAVATLWVLATGTRVEEAHRYGVPPARLRTHPTVPPTRTVRRVVSVFRLGLIWLRHQLHHGYIWRTLWLAPEPWPRPPNGLCLIVHHGP